MNKLTIIGNLTKDPELRTTASGVSVCNFTVAVNRRKGEGADFFSVSAWRERGEVCAKYLAKGRKVCVIGPVSARAYTANDGTSRAQLEVTADEVEFLSSQVVDDSPYPASPAREEAPREIDSTGYEVVDTDELPF